MATEAPPPRNPGLPELGASHEDRDAVVEKLRVAAAGGRLSAAELDERLEAALAARTYADLEILTADRPAAGQRAGVGLPSAKDVIKIDCGSAQVRRDRQWVLPRRIEVRVTSGRVSLDLTQVVIAQPELEVDVSVRSGSVTMITRPGIEVDADDVSVRSGRVRVERPAGAAVPAGLRVRVTGKVSSGRFRARLPRRTFSQWLLTRPLPQG
jgi:phage tail sheath gpL-like